MRANDETSHEADAWDEYLAEFGASAYIEARYTEGLVEMNQAKDGKTIRLPAAWEATYRHAEGCDFDPDDEPNIVYSYTEACGVCGVIHPC